MGRAYNMHIDDTCIWKCSQKSLRCGTTNAERQRVSQEVLTILEGGPLTGFVNRVMNPWFY